MSCVNIQSWIQARRIRLKAAGRHELCYLRCIAHTGRIRRYRTAAKSNLGYREVYTLNPANFLKVCQEWVDLSSVANPTVRIFRNGKEADEYQPARLPFAMKSLEYCRRERWPAYSKGFLYYDSPPTRPRIAGEVKLRLTRTNDPCAFQGGEDLRFLTPTASAAIGQPWKRPLYSIATNSSTRPLYDKLLEEGLVSPELDKSIQSLPKLTFMYSRCQLIHSLYDTFVVDLTSDWVTFVAVAETGIATVRLLRQFKDLRTPGANSTSTYTGFVLARFEPSFLPQHANTRTVVLRFLEELSPVQCLVPLYDEYIERPRPGHLFAKQFHGKLRPWSVDLDRPDRGKVTTAGLKLIWGSTPGLEQWPKDIHFPPSKYTESEYI